MWFTPAPSRAVFDHHEISNVRDVMSTEMLIAAVLVPVVAVLGWVFGTRSGSAKIQGALDQALTPESSAGGGAVSPLVRSLRTQIASAWVPVGSERAAALQEAVGRIQTFMRAAVEDPIVRGLEGDDQALRDGADKALAAVQDLHFYANDGIADQTACDLVSLVRQVNGEFRKDWNGQIRGRLAKDPVSVLVDPEALMDALYLILHNANRFGGKKPIVVEVLSEGAYGRVRIMDGGPGFTSEALSRAYDPFYSTTPDGLGLGLPHARRLVQLMGGEISIRNTSSGGGFVEISLPMA